MTKKITNLTSLPLKLALISILTANSAYSALPPGLKVFRYGLFVSQAESLWVGDKLVDFGKNGKTQFLYNDISIKYGSQFGIELNAGLTYANTEMKRGSEGAVSAGDGQNGISSIKLGAGKSLYNKGSYSVEATLEIEHPFNRGPSSDLNDSPDAFVAKNDGSIHYSLGLSQSYIFSDLFSTTLQVVYIARDTELDDQIKLDLFLPFNITQKFQLGTAFNFKNTFGGVDVLDSSFRAQISERSGGNSKILAFSRVKEKVFGASVFAAYQIDGKWSLDTYINKKIDGQNTDKATSFGTGLTYLMW